MQIEGNIIDIFNKKIFFGSLQVEGKKIESIQELSPNINPNYPYICAGFVDAHVHIESSMLTPIQFARLAVVHGTVATVSDPHEIGNVLGKEGVEYMIHNGRKTPFKFCFGAPSCVPATTFETAGATITPEDIQYLFENYAEVGYLAEVMNFPGVLNQDPDMMAKIALAQQFAKPVDGHAPGLRGEAAKRYIEAGCQTDHECFTIEEALDKLQYGMKILIREGSAAKNFEALIDLLPEHFEQLMFCSDDKHPDSLVEGHINQLIQRALAKYPDLLFETLQVACVNPVTHYQLPVGLLRKGDYADFVIINNLTEFRIIQTYLNGQLVSDAGETLIENLPSEVVNQFECQLTTASDFEVEALGTKINVIEAIDGQLITKSGIYDAKIVENCVVSDIEQDVLKIVVLNRYKPEKPAIAFIKNFGLFEGAIASTVAHDSHNIIAVGVDDSCICKAINLLIQAQGGVSAVDKNGVEKVLALPIGGLMSGEEGYSVAENYSKIDQFAKQLGSKLTSPYMTLSFMALLVIPEIKLSNFGLFDGKSFAFTNLFANLNQQTKNTV
ncbi:MAG: adenine deaminase [Flectobacillus sp.]|nr:adenine deaminase [Flectobacillus sp.]